MARTVMDQLEAKFPDYAERGAAYVKSRYDFARNFLAEDVVHDVVIKFKKLPEQANIEKIHAYFLGALDREALRYATRWLRKREKQVALKEELTRSEEPTVLDEVYRGEEKGHARRKVALLFKAATPEEREVLQLIRNGLSTAEIAEHLKISDSAVRMRMLHLRKRFSRQKARGCDAEEISEPVAPAPVVVVSGPDSIPSATSVAA